VRTIRLEAVLGDDHLVVVLLGDLLGDHQTATTVSGAGPKHLVPASFLAHDPAVLSRIDPWHRQAGLLPSPTAPVWRREALRNRFPDAFSTPPTTPTLRPAR
jgi:hypothetical protein